MTVLEATLVDNGEQILSVFSTVALVSQFYICFYISVFPIHLRLRADNMKYTVDSDKIIEYPRIV